MHLVLIQVPNGCHGPLSRILASVHLQALAGLAYLPWLCQQKRPESMSGWPSIFVAEQVRVSRDKW